jgi:hypothetical protein
MSTIKVLQYNVQGGIREQASNPEDGEGSADDDDFRFVDVLARRVAAEKPQVVTLQEICATQLDLLLTRLQDTYPMTRAATALSPKKVCPGQEDGSDPGDAFGVAILTLGESTVVPENATKLLCADWGESSSAVRVCTAHASPLPKRDIPEIVATVNPWTEQLPVIVTGDLNAEPHQDSMSLLYAPDVPGGKSPAIGRFYEADMCEDQATCGQLTGRDRSGTSTFCQVCLDGAGNGIYVKKFDYILADARHFAPEMTARVEQTEAQCGGTRCSDHAMLWGDLILRNVPQTTPTTSSPSSGGCTIPSDQEILDERRALAGKDDSGTSKYTAVLEKECVDNFLVSKVLVTVNGLVWTEIVAVEYHDCFVTHQDCTQGRDQLAFGRTAGCGRLRLGRGHADRTVRSLQDGLLGMTAQASDLSPGATVGPP